MECFRQREGWGENSPPPVARIEPQNRSRRESALTSQIRMERTHPQTQGVSPAEPEDLFGIKIFVLRPKVPCPKCPGIFGGRKSLISRLIPTNTG